MGPVRFDTDSILIALDVCASASIGTKRAMFIDLKPLDNVFLSGVGGRIPALGIGTMVLNLEDDSGTVHTFKIEDSYYVPKAPINLLCPQQWAKQREDVHGLEDNAHFMAKGTFARMSWGSGTHVMTVSLDDSTNLPLCRTKPSYCQTAALLTKVVTVPAFPTMISDDEGSTASAESDDESNDGSQGIQESEPTSNTSENSTKNKTFPFTTEQTEGGTPAIVEDPILPEDQDELLQMHYKLGHLPFTLIQSMAKMGLLPRKLARCTAPKCASCAFGKQTR